VKQSARRSLVAKVNIETGTQIDSTMLACKRPGTGIPPKELNQVIGKSPKIDIVAEQVITWEMF
jgi:N,N'-diacetyllegionaminate synthase